MQRTLGGIERAEELAAVDTGNVVLEGSDHPQSINGVLTFDVHHQCAVIGEGLGGDGTDADPGKVGELDACKGQC